MGTTLDKIADFPALVEYLRDELEWPIAEADFAKLTFSYTPEEVGLDSARVGGGIEILQLRPLPGLPFGIFFVNLPKKHLSVTLCGPCSAVSRPRSVRRATRPNAPYSLSATCFS